MPQFLATYFNLQPQFAPASWRRKCVPSQSAVIAGEPHFLAKSMSGARV